MLKKSAPSHARPYIVSFVIGAIMIAALLATMFALKSSQEIRSKAAPRSGLINSVTGEYIDPNTYPGYRGERGSAAHKAYQQTIDYCKKLKESSEGNKAEKDKIYKDCLEGTTGDFEFQGQ